MHFPYIKKVSRKQPILSQCMRNLDVFTSWMFYAKVRNVTCLNFDKEVCYKFSLKSSQMTENLQGIPTLTSSQILRWIIAGGKYFMHMGTLLVTVDVLAPNLIGWIWEHQCASVNAWTLGCWLLFFNMAASCAWFVCLV